MVCYDKTDDLVMGGIKNPVPRSERLYEVHLLDGRLVWGWWPLDKIEATKTLSR